MKTKRTKLNSYLFLLASVCLITINSCKKDNLQPATKLNAQEIMQGSNFYKENVKTTVINRFSKMQPNWERVQITKDSSQLVYEVELTNPDQMFISTTEVTLSNAKAFAARNLIRLLVFKEAATGKILSGCYMSIMSDDQNERINSFSYKKMSGFNGKVMYYHLDGSISNGWIYKSGNIIASISKSETQAPNKVLNKSLSTNRNEVSGKTMNKQILDADCITVSFPYYNNACAGVEGYEKCGWMVAGYDQVTTCYNPVGEGGSSGGVTNPPTGGGGTQNSSEITHELNNYPCAKALVLQMPNLSSQIASKINNLFGKSDGINIVFVANQSLIGTNVDGNLIGFSGLNDASVGTYRLGLNPDVLNNATKEYILVTMYHEALHAYLDQKKRSLTTTQYDSQFGGYNVNGGRLLMAQDPAHWPMAYGAFLNGLRDVITEFNSNFDINRANALAKGGITILSSSENNVNKQERNTNDPINNPGYTGTKCP